MIGHPEDWEEVIQDSLLKAWQDIDSFYGRSQFSSWLISIGTRTAIDQYLYQF